MDSNFKDYLKDVLGLNDTHIDAIGNQGITSFTNLQNLDEDNVKSIFRVCRRPGGTLPSKKDAQGNEIGGGNDPGIAIPLMIERRFKQLWYYTQHCANVGRNVTPTGATLSRLNDIWKVKARHEDDDCEDVPLPTKLVDVTKIREIIENVRYYLQTKRGCRGHPLAYVTREDSTVPNVSVDPGVGVPTVNAN